MTGHWAEEAVNNLGSRMVVSGTGSHRYEPDRNVTRAEFVAMIVRGLGLRFEPADHHTFTDVNPSDWYYRSVQTAYRMGFTHGFEDGSFRPDDNITREQAMFIVAEAMALTPLQHVTETPNATVDPLHPFTDADRVSTWAVEGVANSIKAGIIAGKEANRLAPQDHTTRAEVAWIIQRLLQQAELIH